MINNAPRRLRRGGFVLSGIVAHGGATVNGLSRRDGVSHTRDHRLPLPHHDARLPAAEGNYYRTLAPALPATRMLGQWTREVVDAVAERLRTPEALRTYRRIGPLIYTEMSRRIIEADASTLLAEMSQTGVTQAVVVAIDRSSPPARSWTPAATCPACCCRSAPVTPTAPTTPSASPNH